MEFIRGLHNLRPRHRGCVATIGNFDGVHLGHQAVIGQLSDRARQWRLPTLVMLFEPQPQEFFCRQTAPARLMRLREKLQTLAHYPVDRVLCVRFDEKFAALPPEDFIERILVDGLGVRYLVIGDDFRFGACRRGDFSTLACAGERHGFEVAPMNTVTIDGARVSSTRIRERLAAGDLAGAERLLGRRYRLCGRVVHGDKLGRTLGIPTANIHLQRPASPVRGIFVVEVFGLKDEPLPAVASVGTRPTVGGTRCLLEVHLLDFTGDLYGTYLSVEFLKKLRDEERFESLEALKERMLTDLDEARAFFRGYHPDWRDRGRVEGGGAI